MQRIFAYFAERAVQDFILQNIIQFSFPEWGKYYGMKPSSSGERPKNILTGTAGIE